MTTYESNAFLFNLFKQNKTITIYMVTIKANPPPFILALASRVLYLKYVEIIFSMKMKHYNRVSFNFS